MRSASGRGTIQEARRLRDREIFGVFDSDITDADWAAALALLDVRATALAAEAGEDATPTLPTGQHDRASLATD